jgi:hypothetical protein
MPPAELELRRLHSRLYWGREDPDDWGESDHGPTEPRPLHVASLYANYTHLSGVLIRVNGSPLKGTPVCLMGDTPYLLQAVFAPRGKSRTILADAKDFSVVSAFVEGLGIPRRKQP